MKKARRYNYAESALADALILAWIVGGLAVGVAELVLTGENLLDTGGRWQSWAFGGVASILTTTVVYAWRRRRIKTRTLEAPADQTRTHNALCSICQASLRCPNCDAKHRRDSRRHALNSNRKDSVKMIRPGATLGERIAMGFTAAWAVGGLAVGVTELILTGQSPFDTGGAWQSWVAGAVVALLAFATVLFWRRRRRNSAADKVGTDGGVQYD